MVKSFIQYHFTKQNKKIKDFLGHPIIADSIKAALDSQLFETVMVSTEDPDIATVAKQYGAEIPFMRSPENANDVAGLTEVCLEVLATYTAQGCHFDGVCCLLPTAPFVTASRLQEAADKLRTENVDCVFPVVQYGYPIQRSLKIENGRVSMRWPENFTARSQDLEPTYHDAGQFYFIKSETLIIEQRLFTLNAGAIVIRELDSQDIDSEDDWKIAELKASR